MNNTSIENSRKVAIILGVMALTAVFAGSYASAKNASTTKANAGYSKDQCKEGGFQALGFKNQGQCVSFFASGGKSKSASR